MDEPVRKLDHTHPFIAEGWSAVYLPTDYFHLRGEKSERRARFLCIPVAQPQPAAAEALESLSEETGVPVVPLRSLSPRELAQNSGLPQREAEFARQRDFDELFFFAGASDGDIERLLEEARRRKFRLRPQGVLWSLALGASVPQCIRQLTKLFDRALHGHAPSIGLAPREQADELFPACDRNILLAEESEEPHDETVLRPPRRSRVKEISLHAPAASHTARSGFGIPYGFRARHLCFHHGTHVPRHRLAGTSDCSTARRDPLAGIFEVRRLEVPRCDLIVI